MFALFEKTSVYLKTTTVLLKYKYICVRCAAANDSRKHNFHLHFDDETKNNYHLYCTPFFTRLCVESVLLAVRFSSFHLVRNIRRIFEESVWSHSMMTSYYRRGNYYWFLGIEKISRWVRLLRDPSRTFPSPPLEPTQQFSITGYARKFKVDIPILYCVRLSKDLVLFLRSFAIIPDLRHRIHVWYVDNLIDSKWSTVNAYCDRPKEWAHQIVPTYNMSKYRPISPNITKYILYITRDVFMGYSGVIFSAPSEREWTRWRGI